MQLSVTSWSFPACTLAEAWGVARALGLTHMDLGPLHGPALDRAQVVRDPDGAAAEIRALGIVCPNLYWLFGAGIEENSVSDPAALPRNLEELGPVLRFMAALSIPTLFVLPGVHRPGALKRDLMAASAESLRAMLPLARAHGVTLTVEPHIGGLLASPADTLALLDAVPGLKLTLDYAHFACAGFAQVTIDLLAPHAAHVHLRQARPGALQAKWGEGTLDFGAMVATLGEAGYDGALSIEYVHQSYMNTLADDVLTETIRMRDHLRAFGID